VHSLTLSLMRRSNVLLLLAPAPPATTASAARRVLAAWNWSNLFFFVFASVTSVNGDTLPWLLSPVAALVAPLMRVPWRVVVAVLLKLLPRPSPPAGGARCVALTDTK